jgi:Fic family protein
MLFAKTTLLHGLLACRRKPFSQVTIGPKNLGRSVTREGAWEPWLLFVLRGIEETADWTTEKITAVRKLATDTAAHVRRALPKIYSRELVDLIFEQPYCRIAGVVAAGIAGRQAASRYLKALAAVGVLQELAIGKEKLFVHPRLMRLLTRDGNSVQPYPR